MFGLWDPQRICVFGVCDVYTYSESYGKKHLHRILSQHEKRKRGKYIEACLEIRHHFKVDGVMGNDKNVKVKQLDAALLKNGTGNNWKHAGMSRPVSP